MILALRAHNLMHRDQDYVVKDNEVLIVDEFTGRSGFAVPRSICLARMSHISYNFVDFPLCPEIIKGVLASSIKTESTSSIIQYDNPDDILPEAFALVREATKRTLGTEHYPCQILGGIILHEGRIAEMKTGEGKTQTCFSMNKHKFTIKRKKAVPF